MNSLGHLERWRVATEETRPEPKGHGHRSRPIDRRPGERAGNRARDVDDATVRVIAALKIAGLAAVKRRPPLSFRSWNRLARSPPALATALSSRRLAN
jgi:hypothetical protein